MLDDLLGDGVLYDLFWIHRERKGAYMHIVKIEGLYILEIHGFCLFWLRHQAHVGGSEQLDSNPNLLQEMSEQLLEKVSFLQGEISLLDPSFYLTTSHFRWRNTLKNQQGALIRRHEGRKCGGRA